MLDLDTITLTKGSHDTREQGVCLMEAVAWFAGQDHTDRPPCVSPILAGFGISLNDSRPAGRLQELKRFIPLLPGTARDGKDERRGYLALNWLIREYLPAWLDLVPDLAADAAVIRSLPPVTGIESARHTGFVVRQVKDHAGGARAAAAWDAAGYAAGDAAGYAAREAARAAAGNAARHAARDAARNAAWNAARRTGRPPGDLAAGDAARAAAALSAAAWDAAGAAAWNAARNAARPPGDLAAGDALAPTVTLLQDSALALFAWMITADD